MKVTARIEPIERDIDLLIDQNLSPRAQSVMLAGFAREELHKAEEQNRHAGVRARVETFVDGKRKAPLESVRPSGRIVFEFDLILGLFAWVRSALITHSPVGGPPSPAYKANHLLFADGIEIPPGAPIPEAEQYTFVNAVPYSRKIEKGLSPQAPEGVYEVVSVLAQNRFKSIARIRYMFTGIAGGGRQPSIVITPR